MNSHNAKVEAVVRKESVEIESDDESVRVLHAKLADATELSLDENFDIGCDPYNSTGQHVALKPKSDTEE